MSYYTERFVRFGEESSWGTYPSSFEAVNRPTELIMRVTDNIQDRDIIAPSRDSVSRSFLKREVAGSWELPLLSPRLFYYGMGSVSSDASSPYTIDIAVSSSIPSFTLERGIRSPPDGVAEYRGYYGLKIDSLELIAEVDEDVMLRLGLAGKGSTIPSYTWSSVVPSIDYASPAYRFSDVVLKYDGTIVTGLQRVSFEIRNNLEARWEVNQTSDYTCKEIREGLFQVSGRFTTDEDIETYIDMAMDRHEFDLTLELANNTHGTITITLKNVAISEVEDSLRGSEPLEVEFPFVCRPSDAYDTCSVRVIGPYGTISDYPI